MTQPQVNNSNTDAAVLKDRAHGMLAGVAVGDALGMPAEFLNRETIREWYGAISGLRQADSRHPHSKLPAGSVTDDTDHTLMLAELLLDEGSIEPESLAKRLLAWGRSPRVVANRFVGPSTIKTLEALEAGAALQDVPRGGTSNGAAMRVAALAIALPNRAELERQVVASCSVSHYTWSGCSGAMAMAFGLSEALQPGADINQVAAAAIKGEKRGLQHGTWSWTAPLGRRIEHVLHWVRTLDEAQVLDNMFELIGVDMYADQLVPLAIGLTALGNGDANKSMLLAANLGGDSDTLASMTGSFAGALGGTASINADWLATVTEVNNLDLGGLASQLVAFRNGRSA